MLLFLRWQCTVLSDAVQYSVLASSFRIYSSLTSTWGDADRVEARLRELKWGRARFRALVQGRVKVEMGPS